MGAPTATGRQHRSALPTGRRPGAAAAPAGTAPVLATSLSVPVVGLGAGLVLARLAGAPLALPCPLTLLGAACPLCGVSRAATALVTADAPGAAAQAPAVAIVLALLAMTVVVLVGWLRGRSTPPPRAAVVYLGVLPVLLAVNWVWQLRVVGVL